MDEKISIMKKKITNKDGRRGLTSVQYLWEALKAFFSKTLKKII